VCHALPQSNILRPDYTENAPQKRGFTVTVKSASLVFVSVLFAGVCPGLSAGQPGSHSLGYYKYLTVANCGDFSVMDDASVRADIKDFLDAGGNLYRSHIHLTAMDDFYRKDDSEGRHLAGSAHGNERVFFDEAGYPLWSPSDILIAMHMSRAGVLLVDVGKLQVNASGDWYLEFTPNRFHDWTAADYEAVCAYFG
jgi:hypothetical protein